MVRRLPEGALNEYKEYVQSSLQRPHVTKEYVSSVKMTIRSLYVFVQTPIKIEIRQAVEKLLGVKVTAVKHDELPWQD